MITMSSFKHAGLIISIITSLISCTHNKNYTTTFQPELAKAEAIMYRYPDSALHILQGIQPDNPSDNEQYATWALLMTQAQYKNQIEQSDSLINIAYSYFINQDNAQRKALALYYKGILCHESHHAEDALSFYLEATTRLPRLQALLPLCDMALITGGITHWTECTFAHVPMAEFTPQEIKKITPVKLDRQIIDLLANREYIIERQKHLCAFFESESERMNEIADWLINRVKQKRQL